MTNLKTSWNEFSNVFLTFCFALGYSLAGIVDSVASLLSAIFWFFCALLIIGLEVFSYFVMAIFHFFVKKEAK